jgi:serine/alanine adding enzyme
MDIEIIREEKKWKEVLPVELSLFHSYEFHEAHSPIYSKNLESDYSGEPELFVWRNKGKKIVYPFLRRKIENSEYFDIISVYGYSGPFLINEPIIKLKESDMMCFTKNLTNYLYDSGVISELTRLHPFISSTKFYENSKETVIDCIKGYYLNISEEEEEVRKNLKRSWRGHLNSSEGKGLIFKLEKLNEISEEKFIRIQEKFSLHKNLKNKCFNEEGYLKRIFKNLKNNLSLVSSLYKGSESGMSIILHDDFHSFYWLSFMDYNLKHLNSDHFRAFHSLRYSQDNTKTKIFDFMGGGENIGLHKFKEGIGRNQSGVCLVKKIINKEVYKKMKEKTLSLNPNVNQSFFPIYRSK